MDLESLKQNLNKFLLAEFGISTDIYLINLETYKFLQNISKSNKSEDFVIQNKENNNFFIGKILNINISNISDVKNSNLYQILYICTKLNNPSIPKLIGFSLI